MARPTNKTLPTTVSPTDFISGVEPPQRRADAHTLLALFGRITGWQPVMWGPGIIGFGCYHYRYESGREGIAPVTGFSPRKTSLVIYIMPGYGDLAGLLHRLGKHRLGKSCLYLNKLADVDLQVLEEIIRAGLARMQAKYAVTP